MLHKLSNSVIYARRGGGSRITNKRMRFWSSLELRSDLELNKRNKRTIEVVMTKSSKVQVNGLVITWMGDGLSIVLLMLSMLAKSLMLNLIR